MSGYSYPALLLAGALLAVPVPPAPAASAATELAAIDVATVERKIEQELAATRTPGAAIAMVRDGQIILARGFGKANVETGEAVRPEMLFRIASTTKMFVAATAVKLAEDGKFSLDQPIGKYIPGLPPTLARVTTSQLLSHQAGLIDESPAYGPHDDDALAASIRGWTDAYSFAPPGETFSYSNPGYRLTGLLIEKLSGRAFADQMQELLFAPLGMTRTTFRPTKAMTWPLALGHEVGQDRVARIVRPYVDNAATWPTGSIFSNVLELSRFTIAFMNGGMLEGKRVLSPSLIETLVKPRVAVGSPGISYGYGLEVHTHRGVRIVEHGGGRPGYGSTIMMAPDHRAAVIVLSNGSGDQLRETALTALSLIVPFKAEVPVDSHIIGMTREEMVQYAGTYIQGAMTMRMEMRNDMLHVVQGQSALPVDKIAPGLFCLRVPNAPAPVTFSITDGPDGKPRYLLRGRRALRKLDAQK